MLAIFEDPNAEFESPARTRAKREKPAAKVIDLTAALTASLAGAKRTDPVGTEGLQVLVQRKALKAALAQVMRAVPGRTTLPILSHVELRTENDLDEDTPFEGRLVLTGTDLDLRISVRVPARVYGLGALCVPAKALKEIVTAAQAEVVALGIAGAFAAGVRDGASTATLPAMSPEEFPLGVEVKYAPSDADRVTGFALREMIDKTLYAVSTDESRPIINGVLWQRGKESQLMVATNGCILAKHGPLGKSGSDNAQDFIVPTKALSAALAIFADEDLMAIGHAGDTLCEYLALASAHATIVTRLIEGPYPNYDQVIPKDHEIEATVFVESLVEALKAVNVVASKGNAPKVVFAFEADKLTLSANVPDHGNAQRAVSVVKWSSPKKTFEIAFNPRYVLETLKHIEGEQVRITMKHPDRAACWFSADDPLQTMLTMPLRLVD